MITRLCHGDYCHLPYNLAHIITITKMIFDHHKMLTLTINHSLNHSLDHSLNNSSNHSCPGYATATTATSLTMWQMLQMEAECLGPTSPMLTPPALYGNLHTTCLSSLLHTPFLWDIFTSETQKV